MTTVAPAISTLNSVSWTELNGTNLSSSEKTRITGLVANINRLTDAAKATWLPQLFRQLGPNDKFSLNDVIAWVNNQPSNITPAPRLTGMTAATTTADLRTLVSIIQQEIASVVTADTRLTVTGWYELLNKLKGESFKEASKLSVRDGGGLKTFGNKWYANGEELTYMDVTFAVRVNQLFVINSTITDNLQSVQKNNAKIKFANKVAAIVSSLSPTGSSGTVSAQKLASQILAMAIKEGLVSAPVPTEYYTGTLDQVYAKLPIDQAVLVKLTNTNSYGIAPWTPVWMMRYNNGAFDAKYYDPNNPLTEFKGVAKSTYGDIIDTYNYSTHQGYDLTALLEIMPSSLSKIFNTDWGQMKSSSTTLTQNECTTITTEIKSYTSGLDSDNQLLQTQLSQYNDKRTEVLDQITSIVKGNSASLSSIARNLSAA